MNERLLRTQIAFVRDHFRSNSVAQIICDALDTLLAKEIDEPLLRATMTDLRQQWSSNDGAEGDSIAAICDALERLLADRSPSLHDLRADRDDLQSHVHTALEWLSGIGDRAGEALHERLQKAETAISVGSEIDPGHRWTTDLLREHADRLLKLAERIEKFDANERNRQNAAAALRVIVSELAIER